MAKAAVERLIECKNNSSDAYQKTWNIEISNGLSDILNNIPDTKLKNHIACTMKTVLNAMGHKNLMPVPSTKLAAELGKEGVVVYKYITPDI